MGSKEIPKKRETWDDLIDLVYISQCFCQRKSTHLTIEK
jgi:hypothetical protein